MGRPSSRPCLGCEFRLIVGERIGAYPSPALPPEQDEPRPTIAPQRFEAAKPTPAREIADGAVNRAVLIADDLDRRALDQTDELAAGDVGVYPVAERLFLPPEIRGEVLRL
jgi:hypothetical protein